MGFPDGGLDRVKPDRLLRGRTPADCHQRRSRAVCFRTLSSLMSRFQISADADGVRHKQFYWPSTNVLVTRFLLADGIAELEDFMPAGLPTDSPQYHHLYRRIRCVRGAVRISVSCRPAFDYGRQTHDIQIEANGAIFKSGSVSPALSTNVSLRDDGHGGVTAEFVLAEGKSQVFTLRDDCADGVPCPPSEKEAEQLLRGTVKFWHDWLSSCTYHGRS